MWSVQVAGGDGHRVYSMMEHLGPDSANERRVKANQQDFCVLVPRGMPQQISFARHLNSRWLHVDEVWEHLRIYWSRWWEEERAV